MSPEFLAHIFDPFTQERQDARSVYQGTGLGMAIVKRLIDAMGGTISITSEEGKGSTFVITIPCEIVNTFAAAVGPQGQAEGGSTASSGSASPAARARSMGSTTAGAVRCGVARA